MAGNIWLWQVQERPRSRNSVPRLSVDSKESSAPSSAPSSRQSSDVSRPAPAALQEILDRPSVGRARPQQVEEQTQQTPQRPARLEVVTNRPNFRNTFRQTLQTTSPTTTETSFRSRPFSSR